MRTFPYALSLPLALFLLGGCHEHDQAPKEIVSVQPAVRTIVPEYGTFTTQITATASVQPSPDGIVTLNAPSDGTVQTIHVGIGDRVTRNAPVVSLRSSDVSDVQSERLSAKAAYEEARRVHTMNQELYRLGAITANDLALSQSQLEQSRAVLGGYSQKLNYLGASSEQTMTLRSPIAGVVYEIDTHLGEKVSADAAQPLVKIADPRKKVVVATVYEKDLSAFQIGKEVTIAADPSGTGTITGHVTYVSDVLDPENKTNKVYIEPTTDSSQLRINMFADITLKAERSGVFRIPKTALLYREGKFTVFVKRAEQFVPLNVTLVSDDPEDNFSLVKGLTQNTPIALEAISLEKQ